MQHVRFMLLATRMVSITNLAAGWELFVRTSRGYIGLVLVFISTHAYVQALQRLPDNEETEQSRYDSNACRLFKISLIDSLRSTGGVNPEQSEGKHPANSSK